MDLEDDVSSVLAGATSMFVAVDSKRGPHVTPELFVEVNGRLWSFTAAGTLKVKALRRTSRAGVLVRNGDDAVVLATDVTIVDGAKPLAVATSGLALDIPQVTAAFAARHALEVAGGAADYAAGRFGLVPGRGVLLAFEPVAVALVRDGALVSARGWDEGEGGTCANVDAADGEPGDASGASDVEIDIASLPEVARDLIGRNRAALGWYGSHGVVALPARWDVGTATATVDRFLFDATGCVASGAAAVTVDEWIAPGPGGKRGVMVRGQARTAHVPDHPEDVAVTLEAERAVVWDGTETESVSGIRDFPGEAGHTATVSDPYKDPKKETRAG